MAYSVLIVDDDKELRAIYRLILDRRGYVVYEAANGAEALKFLINQTPDAIMLDVLMPMLGGEAIMQRIRQMPALANTALIVLTAYPRFREASTFQDADRFLVKPIKPAELLDALAGALAAHGPGGQQLSPPS